MPEAFLTLLLIPSLGGAVLLAEWLSRTALGRPERDVWRLGLCAAGIALLAISPVVGYFAVARLSGIEWLQSLLLVGRLLLLATLVVGGVTAIRVSRIGEDDVELPPQLAATRSRDVDRLRLTAWVLVVFPLLWFVITALLFAAPLAYVLAVASTSGRARRARLLWVLTLSVENELSLPDELDAFAAGRWWREARRLHYLASRLRDGTSLAGALESQPGLLPATTVSAIRVGERAGILPSVLRDTASRCMTDMRQAHLDGPLAAMAFYYWILMIVMLVVVGGVSKWIIPKHKEILRGFDVEIPAVTQFVFAAADWTREYLWLSLPLLVVPASLLMVLMYVYLVGWPNFNWPLLMRWFPRRDAPGVLRSLSAAVASGGPLPDLLAEMAEHHGRRDLSRRLARIGEAVSAGGDAWNCLVDERLLTRREAAVVSAAARAGHLPFALNALADSLERVQGHRRLWWIEICKPLVVLSIGMIVAVYAVGMFLPLVEMMKSIK